MSEKSRARARLRKISRAKSVSEFPGQNDYNAEWLADFSALAAELSEQERANFDMIKTQFPKAKAGRRASKGGAPYWYLLDPQMGPMAGPLA